MPRSKKQDSFLKNNIVAFLHCKECLKELPDGVSPAEWSAHDVGWTEKDYKYGVVDTKQMCCMSTSKGTSILQLQRVSRKKTNLKKEKYTHLLGDQETSASQTVIRGQTVSLGRTTKMASFRLQLNWHQQLLPAGARHARRSLWN